MMTLYHFVVLCMRFKLVALCVVLVVSSAVFHGCSSSSSTTEPTPTTTSLSMQKMTDLPRAGGAVSSIDFLDAQTLVAIIDGNLATIPVSGGAPTMLSTAGNYVSVNVGGAKEIEGVADALVNKLKDVSYLRDVQIQQPLHLPTISIHFDREKIAQLGMRLNDVVKSVTDATASSRFTEKNQWLDENVAYTYQVQVQVPEVLMNDMSQLKTISLVRGGNRPMLSDVASFSIDTIPGEYDRSGPRRFITVSANIRGKDLGTATAEVHRALDQLGALPKGLRTEVRGMSSLLEETFSSLQLGLLTALVVILLLLAANYQSFRVSLVVLATTPAVLVGALVLLLATGSTLNLQSYMGIIMAIGVSVANSILIVTNAESLRLRYADASRAALTSASIRLRPILMTSLAMIAGMIPMALGFGEAGDQTAPLGRAVIGGLMASTVAALYIIPLVYASAQQKASLVSPSLLPETITAQELAKDLS